MRERKLVVAGLIIGSDNRILISQRKPGGPIGGKWEFPGGKLEEGESPVDALVRELREELGVETAVGRIWDVLFHAYPAFDLVMMIYACRITGEPRAIDVADVAWCAIADLAHFDILPADRPLVDRLVAEGPPALLL